MKDSLEALRETHVVLHDAELLRRRRENRAYLMDLPVDKLLLHHRFEAGLDTRLSMEDDLHGGWEAPLCQVRGHFVGHWLSAAAIEVAATGDAELRARAEVVIQELTKCQEANGNGWCAPIPEKYLRLIERGYSVWAPQYTIHKTFMGLLDAHAYMGSMQALEIADRFSRWFCDWTQGISDDHFQRILDVETGGMLEIWSQLYGVTKDPAHRRLMDRYYRKSLFDGLLAGHDVLTNMHANTTIPEALGAARAYEVTGEEKWLDIVRAYWREAVSERGFFCTGGQTSGEIWTPKHRFAARLGDKNQEHCTVYNMMRLADFLFQVTGEVQYADYWERNLHNGIMAQAYYRNDRATHGATSPDPQTGLLSYFLPLKSGARKGWASRDKHFFCCHGSLVQANAGHIRGIYYRRNRDLYICQYTPSDAGFTVDGVEVTVRQRADTMAGNDHMVGSMTGSQTINRQAATHPNHPEKLRSILAIAAEAACQLTIRIRVPWWHQGETGLTINGKAHTPTIEDGFVCITREWQDDTVCVEFGKRITTEALPDRPDTVAFLFGPLVLAGIHDDGHCLRVAQGQAPETLLAHAEEREWAKWRDTFQAAQPDRTIQFVPLNQVGYEPYSVYFPIEGLQA